MGLSIGCTQMLLARMTLVLLLSAAFAGAFAGVVRYAAHSNFRGDACRVIDNRACYGPYSP